MGCDVQALLATLFLSRGVVMLTAGDEFGRTQKGNNNAYAQDNETTWLDWKSADLGLMDYVIILSRLRKSLPLLVDPHFIATNPTADETVAFWFGANGTAFDWIDREQDYLGLMLSHGQSRLALVINGGEFSLPLPIAANPKHEWFCLFSSVAGDESAAGAVAVFEERVA